MNGEPQILRLETGTQLAFDEYGDPGGAPVFFCHGWPSSRTMAELTDKAASELGLRIISPDRPGIRDSNFHPNRTLLDWPPLLRELAAHLQIDKFKILAISGGASITAAAHFGWPVVNALLALLYLPMLIITWKAPEPAERVENPELAWFYAGVGRLAG